MPAISRFPTPDQTRLPHAARAVLAQRAARLRVLLGDPRKAARIARDFRQAAMGRGARRVPSRTGLGPPG